MLMQWRECLCTSAIVPGPQRHLFFLKKVHKLWALFAPLLTFLSPHWILHYCIRGAVVAILKRALTFLKTLICHFFVNIPHSSTVLISFLLGLSIFFYFKKGSIWWERENINSSERQCNVVIFIMCFCQKNPAHWF